MKILVHACPKRMWYVTDFLVPMLKEQADRIMCSNDEGVIADIIEAIERGELL